MLHACHPGIVSMKALSRSYVWWPGINEDIEKLSKHCHTCQMNQNNPQKTTPHPWIPATRAWERIHIDFAQLFDRQWLVVVDSYSKFPEIVDMGHNTKSEATIKELRKLFSVYGLPRLVVSDRGPQLVSILEGKNSSRVTELITFQFHLLLRIATDLQSVWCKHLRKL